MIACSGNVVQLWSISSHASFYKFNDMKTPVNSMCFTSDGEKLCIGSDSEYLNVINLYTGETSAFETQSPTINIVRSSPDGQFLATGSKTGPITLFTRNANEPLTFRQHKFAITAMTFTSDSTSLISGDKRGIISIGSFKPSKLPNWPGKVGQIRDITITKNMSLMSVAAGENTIFYDFNQQKVSKNIHFGACQQIKFSPFSDSLLAIATQVGDLYFFDPNTDEIINQTSFSNQITAMDFRFDGRVVSVAIKDQGIKLLDIRNLLNEIKTVDLFTDKSLQLNTIAFQPCIVKKPIFEGFHQNFVNEFKEIAKNAKIESKTSNKQTNSSTSNHNQNNSLNASKENMVSANNSILNSILDSSFDNSSKSLENIDITKLEPNQEQSELIRIAKEINKTKKSITELSKSFDVVSPKPIKKKDDQSQKPNSLAGIITDFFSMKLEDINEELHEHANRIHLDIIQKVKELEDKLIEATV
ncbi:hypothetical protein TRFO_19600 [Tritrichomonas foetus]|uniref:Anaphase-promoting complex subunit 4-like WD40 domain-containing protein n=1 Tax=Tritrichomonas foetus TaxID=1144522 RepID=A0A1J4KIM0_9EUKA|nr:hypothetical protein TRFO_19600 [Tritrichomonas foetus]|eukprot:OHT10922.1 hypothetical protein TRFO_19600 [Tritrichomonas foetus]